MTAGTRISTGRPTFAALNPMEELNDVSPPTWRSSLERLRSAWPGKGNRAIGLPASAHRDSRCQAVHRTSARSSGDVAQAGAAYQRDIANTAVTQRIWEQPAPPPDPAKLSPSRDTETDVLATCEVPNGYLPTDSAGAQSSQTNPSRRWTAASGRTKSTYRNSQSDVINDIDMSSQLRM